MEHYRITGEAINGWKLTCNRNRKESNELVLKKIKRALKLGKSIYKTKIEYMGEPCKLFEVIRFYDIDIHIWNKTVVNIYRNREIPLVKASLRERILYDKEYGIPSRYTKEVKDNEKQIS